MAARGDAGVDLVRVSGDRRCWAGYTTQYGLTLVTAGAFDFWYRQASWRSVAGTVKLKEPGEIHRDLRVVAPVTAQTIALAPALVAEAAGAHDQQSPHFRSVLLGRRDPVWQVVARLHASLAAREVDRFVRESLLADALAAVLSAHSESARPAPRTDRPAVLRARDYLHAHIASDVRLADVAAAAGIDRFHLVRCFARELGVPPYEYLTHLRVARARSLLAAGLGAARVAAEVGFCDQSQLHRHFARRLGVAPGAYGRAARSRTPKLGRRRSRTPAA